jgi:ABC-type branched-subunit amino acid transport system ATPase component
MPILDVEGLDVRYGGVHAVRDFSLAVEERTVVGLIGPNGAGKSSVIQALCGSVRPYAGRVTFDGHEIHGKAPFRIGRLGLMRTFQIARVWPALTVMENMLAASVEPGDLPIWRGLFMFGGLRRKQHQRRLRARGLLEEFGIASLENDLAGHLSGGQKRLLEFARLLMAKPRMVLLDEPLAGISPTMALRIQEAVEAFPRAGVSVLIVEHNLGFVDAVCERAVVMALGTSIATGEMAALRVDPAVLTAYLGSVSDA